MPGSAARSDARPPGLRPGAGSRQQHLQEQEAEAAEPHWGLGVYQRVFLTEAAAQAWHSWNNMRGDPAQPFHYQYLLRQLQQQVGMRQELGRRHRLQHAAEGPASVDCQMVLTT